MNKKLRMGLIIVFLAASYGSVKLFGLESSFTPEGIKNIFSGHVLVASFLYILFFTAGNLLQIPGGVFLVGAVWALGKVNAYGITLTAAFVSSFAGYFIIRFLGQDAIRQIKYRWVQNLLGKMDRRPVLVNVVLRVVFQTAPMLNYTLALSGVKLKDYAWGIVLGLPLPILMYTIFIDEIIKVLL